MLSSDSRFKTAKATDDVGQPRNTYQPASFHFKWFLSTAMELFRFPPPGTEPFYGKMRRLGSCCGGVVVRSGTVAVIGCTEPSQRPKNPLTSVPIDSQADRIADIVYETNSRNIGDATTEGFDR